MKLHSEALSEKVEFARVRSVGNHVCLDPSQKSGVEYRVAQVVYYAKRSTTDGPEIELRVEPVK